MSMNFFYALLVVRWKSHLLKISIWFVDLRTKNGYEETENIPFNSKVNDFANIMVHGKLSCHCRSFVDTVKVLHWLIVFKLPYNINHYNHDSKGLFTLAGLARISGLTCLIRILLYSLKINFKRTIGFV